MEKWPCFGSDLHPIRSLALKGPLWPLDAKRPRLGCLSSTTIAKICCAYFGHESRSRRFATPRMCLGRLCEKLSGRIRRRSVANERSRRFPKSGHGVSGWGRYFRRMTRRRRESVCACAALRRVAGFGIRGQGSPFLRHASNRKPCPNRGSFLDEKLGSRFNAI